MQKTLPLLTLSLLLAACGGNSGSSAQAPAAPAQTPAANASQPAGSQPAGAQTFAPGKGSISEDRTTSFKAFMPNFSKMRKMVNGDTAFQAEEFKTAAAAFAKDARVPFQYFQNDPNGNGDALPAVWQKPADFKAEQDKFFAAVDKLNTAAQTGKLDDIKAAFGPVGESCKSCHTGFRLDD